jgi:hypothetical protein
MEQLLFVRDDYCSPAAIQKREINKGVQSNPFSILFVDFWSLVMVASLVCRRPF